MSVNYVDAAKDGIKTQALLKQNYKTFWNADWSNIRFSQLRNLMISNPRIWGKIYTNNIWKFHLQSSKNTYQQRPCE